MNIIFIFARSGSKGLKNKNIKIFNGKPLIYWTIKQAKKLKYVDEIILSTDNKKIADIGVKYGAKVYFLRPKTLAKDNTNMFVESGKYVWNYYFRSATLWLSPKAEYDYPMLYRNCLKGRNHNVIN